MPTNDPEPEEHETPSAPEVIAATPPPALTTAGTSN